MFVTLRVSIVKVENVNAMKRNFSARDRKIIYQRAKGLCQQCNVKLNPLWHADHVIPVSLGGETHINNGQALCIKCNLKKSNKVKKSVFQPRDWQSKCMTDFQASYDLCDPWPNPVKRNYLIGAVVGAGKSKMAAWMAWWLYNEGAIDTVIIFSPQAGKKSEWVGDFKKYFDLAIQSNYSSSGIYRSKTKQGLVMTYAGINRQVEADMERILSTTQALVIADEPHHMSMSNRWGLRFDRTIKPRAKFIIFTSGTYWREDNQRIPILPYDPKRRCYDIDYRYTYTDSLEDGNSRKIEFIRHDVKIRDFEVPGHEEEERFTGLFSELAQKYPNEDRVINAAYRQIVKYNYTELREIFEEMASKLAEVMTDKRYPHKNAKVSIWAPGIDEARAIRKFMADEMGITDVMLVHSKGGDEDSEEEERQLEEFKNSDAHRWLITVDMFSEGVDIPDMRLGLYLGIAKTRLRFQQSAVGRTIRVKQDEYLKFRDPQHPLYGRNLYSYVWILRHPLLEEWAENVEGEIEMADIQPPPPPPPPPGPPRPGPGGPPVDVNILEVTGLVAEGISRGHVADADLMSIWREKIEGLNIDSAHLKSEIFENFVGTIAEAAKQKAEEYEPKGPRVTADDQYTLMQNELVRLHRRITIQYHYQCRIAGQREKRWGTVGKFINERYGLESFSQAKLNVGLARIVEIVHDLRELASDVTTMDFYEIDNLMNKRK